MKFTQRAKEWMAVEENYKKLLATKQAIIWILTAILIVPDIVLGYYYKINPMLIQHIGCFIRPINFITSQIMPNNILSEITQSCVGGNKSEKAIFFMDFMTKFALSFFFAIVFNLILFIQIISNDRIEKINYKIAPIFSFRTEYTSNIMKLIFSNLWILIGWAFTIGACWYGLLQPDISTINIRGFAFGSLFIIFIMLYPSLIIRFIYLLTHVSEFSRRRNQWLSMANDKQRREEK